MPEPIRVVLAFGSAASPWTLPTYRSFPDHIDARVLAERVDLADGDFVRAVRTVGSPLRSLPGPVAPLVHGTMERLYPSWRRIAGMREWLQGADVVNTVEIASGPSLQAARLKQALGYRLVITAWENIAWRGSAHPAVRAAKHRVIAGADHFLAVTERARSALILEGASEERITVVPPGVDLSHVPVANESTPRSDGPIRFLMVAKKQRSKGVLELLQALALLARDGDVATRGVEMHCVGFSPSEGPYGSAARRLGVLPLLREHGSVPWDRIGTVYANADAFVLPSRITPLWQEQWGMVLTEARGAGLPIVATASGSIPEAAGPAALLANPNDPHSLYRRMREMCLNLVGYQEAALAEATAVRSTYAPRRIARLIASTYARVLQ